MRIFFIVLSTLLFVACGNSEKKANLSENKANKLLEIEHTNSVEYVSFGKKITEEQSIASEEMYEKYKKMEIGDTLDVKFSAQVSKVCKNKGCWMKLSLPNGNETMVKFKDYAFFVPKDIEEKKVVVHGKAYVAVVSVEEQRHYAKDAGKNEAEISAITQPKRTLSFEADGVLIKQ